MISVPTSPKFVAFWGTQYPWAGIKNVIPKEKGDAVKVRSHKSNYSPPPEFIYDAILLYFVSLASVTEKSGMGQ